MPGTKLEARERMPSEAPLPLQKKKENKSKPKPKIKVKKMTSITNNIVLKEFSEEKEYISPIQHNLIETLEEKGPLTRKDLVNHLNSPRTTVYDNLIKLQKRKLIQKFSKNNGTKGRPLVFWRLI